MVKKILGTIGTRLINALLAFIVVLLTTRYLGASNYGTVSLIILAVAIIQLLNSFISGGALIFLSSRAGPYRLFFPAYIWTVLITLLGTWCLHLAGLIFPKAEVIPTGYFWPILLLALVMSFVSVNSMILLGLERVHSFNLLNLLQIVTHVGTILVYYFILDIREVKSYYMGLLISYILSFVVSLWLLIPLLKPEPFSGMRQLMKEVLQFGLYIQFANIFQQLNYRMSYYIVDAFAGRAAVGVLSAGVQMAEGLWLIGRSIAMVLFSRLSNQDDDAYSRRLTLTMAKITWIITLFGLVALLAVPAALFETLFGRDFSMIKPVIATLGIGVVTLSVSMVFSSFFAGYNKPYHNTVSSAIGLLFTVVLGLLLIPSMGVLGAGITATVSYTAATLYQLVVFARIAGLHARDLMLTMSEIRMIKTEVVSLLKQRGV